MKKGLPKNIPVDRAPRDQGNWEVNLDQQAIRQPIQ